MGMHMKQAALLGMPNCGKSSIYHLLTGRRTATGNRAGVTVTADTAPLSGPGERILLTDLPGIRSAHPASEDESVTLRYLKSQTPELLIAVLDATDAARQLPPVCELLRLSSAGSLLMVFNFCDELERFPDAAELSRLLNIPVYAVSARTGQGIPELAAAVRTMAAAGGPDTSNGCLDCNRERRTGGASTNDPSPVCDGCAGCHRKAVHHTAKTQEKEEFGLPLGAKGEFGPVAAGNRSNSRRDGRIISGTGSEAAGRCAKPGAVHRTGFCIRTEQITTVCSLLGRVSEKKQRRSNRLDHLFLRPACGFPLFFLMMLFILWLTFGPPGEALTAGFCNLVLSPLSALLLRLCTGAPAWLASLLQNGVLGGVGAVLSFLPRLALLFLFQAVLEQCGLLARVNRLFDPIFCKFGLRGDAVTPLLLGFGCSVPAVLCTRAMKDRACRERYDDLTRQRDDLIRAEADLQGIIETLQRQMERQFMENFRLMQQYFAETFSKLFGGGHAELRLLDEHDVLGCGIEIVARQRAEALVIEVRIGEGSAGFAQNLVAKRRFPASAHTDDDLRQIAFEVDQCLLFAWDHATRRPHGDFLFLPFKCPFQSFEVHAVPSCRAKSIAKRRCLLH